MIGQSDCLNFGFTALNRVFGFSCCTLPCKTHRSPHWLITALGRITDCNKLGKHISQKYIFNLFTPLTDKSNTDYNLGNDTYILIKHGQNSQKKLTASMMIRYLKIYVENFLTNQYAP